jgi:molybdate transport system permease protein
MAMEPDALLLDEPFAALDPHLRRRTEEQLRATLAGFSGPVVFVTHDMEEAFRFCSELQVLDAGRVIASGPKHKLFERPRTVATAQLTGCKNIAMARRAGNDWVEVDAWQCRLRSAVDVPEDLTHVGFRSHQMVFQKPAGTENTFLCWLVTTSEAPHEMTLYLRMHLEPLPGQAPHLQADVSKDVWRDLSRQPQPWHITLDPARLLLLES